MFWGKWMPTRHYYTMSQDDMIAHCIKEANAHLKWKSEDLQKKVDELYRALEIEREKVKALQECIRGEAAQ